MCTSTDPNNRVYRDIWILLQELGVPDPFVQDFERDGRNKVSALNCNVVQTLRRVYGMRTVDAGVQAIVTEDPEIADGGGLVAQALPTLSAPNQPPIVGQAMAGTNAGQESQDGSVTVEVNHSVSVSGNRKEKDDAEGKEQPTRAVSDAVTQTVDADAPSTSEREVRFVVDQAMSLPEDTYEVMLQKGNPVETRAISPTSGRSKPDIKAVQKRGKTPLQLPVQASFPKWLTETVPKPFPYFPQIGDVVYYYQKGHQKYVRRLIKQGVSSKSFKGMPKAHWNLKEVEVLQIVALKFVNISVKLPAQSVPTIHHIAEIEMKRKGTAPNGKTFKISFHSVPHIEDFLVLEHRVLRNQNKRWHEGARVKNLLLDTCELCWFKGTIDSVMPDAPGMYHMLKVRCDVSVYVEKISPWNLRLITPEEDESVEDGDVATAAELHSMQAYKPTPADWNNQDPATERRRILRLLHSVLSLKEAEQFAAPVGLERYPDYVKKIAYPVDLKTIKQRLSQQFYRHKAALLFDIKQIASNCEKFYLNAPISMHANIIVAICTDIVNNPSSLLLLGSAYIERIRMEWRTEFEARKKSEPAGCRAKTNVNTFADSSVSDSDEEKSADDDKDSDFSLQPGDGESSDEETDTEPPTGEMSEASSEDDNGGYNHGRKARPQRKTAVPERWNGSAFQPRPGRRRDSTSDESEIEHPSDSRRKADKSARRKSGDAAKPLCNRTTRENAGGIRRDGKRKTVEEPTMQRLRKRSTSTLHFSYAESDLETDHSSPEQSGRRVGSMVWTETLSGRKVKRPEVYKS
ncbi:bromodomain and WD repeat-containing protein 3-like [Paramacrobiotus metropolitanus]|uniref:bromodomain and WD repeat-containing protein 3-like n=1 Tax=Paramacrobiotus metropolitanus TaxID=2943436 RepID=UPI0024457A9A|nr:bromodomain and WD repeat-containing protein 3-like [Paramacrobiotus metropolitanus]